jgi:apolipoprotein N-acyltransferase
MVGYGAWRLPAEPSPLVAGVKLRLMQPNLPQDAKFSPRNSEAILNQYLALSDRATTPTTLGVQDATHLIWPESAFPFLLGRTPAALSRIAALLPPQATLITGAARGGEALPGEARPPIYNAIQVVDDEGAILSSYDKVHLVPFGEYLPAIFATLIRSVGLSEFVAVPGGFAAGPRRAILSVRGLPPVAPLICYEAIFPGEVMPEQGPRPGLMLNLTNDGWFGQTSGPYQHFAQARMRAIEQGLPLVRVANTGISGVIDGYGRVIASLPLRHQGVLDSGLPRSVSETPYSRYGELGLLVIILTFSLFFRHRRN